MCLMMVSLGALPKREHLVNAAENNPDGFGFAVNHGDHIVTGRSMTADTLIDRFYAEMSKSSTPVGMFHARFTTHGVTAVENNHPFRVGGRKDLVLAHNGMLPVAIAADDIRSDTRIFAEDILPAFGPDALDDSYVFSALEDLTAGSKVAVLSTAPELRDSVYILNEALGHWKGDIWWSNHTYEYSYTNYFRAGYGYGRSADLVPVRNNGLWWETDEDTPASSQSAYVFCQRCDSNVPTDGYDDYCVHCTACFDCGEMYGVCVCYAPAAGGRVPNFIDNMVWDC